MATASPYILTHPNVVAPMVPQVQMPGVAPAVIPVQSGNSGGVNIPSIPNLGINSGQGPMSISGITNGVQGAVDRFGTHLGFGVGNSPDALLGATPVQGAGSLTSSSLSAFGGNALGGFGVGSMVAGLTGGNSTAGGVGGGLGSAAALALGFTGPIGMIGGGIVGGLLGGKLFGKKKPSDMTQSGGVDIKTGQVNDYYATSQSSTGKKYSESNAQVRDQLQNSVAGLSQWILANGGSVKYGDKEDRDFIIQYGSRDGYKWWDEGAAQPNQYGNDYAGFSKSLTENVIDKYYVPPETKAKLDAMNKGDILNWQQSLEGKGTGESQAIQLPGRGTPDDQNSFATFLQSYRQTQEQNKVA